MARAPLAVDTDEVDVIRRFSRLFTTHLGVLDEDVLGRDRPLGESRTLFEIGRGTTSVADLRDRLGLDSGYLSRLLRRLERADLVRTEPDPDDGRRRRVSLTDAGRREWDALDRLSDHRVRTLLAPLGAARVGEVTRLVRQVHRLLAAATAHTVRTATTDPAATMAMTAYFQELDRAFQGGFDPGEWHQESAAAFDADAGAFVLLRSDDRVAGCGAWQTIGDGIGEIKRMWLDPDVRGLGLGRRLLEDLEARVAAHGHHTVRLDTNRTLTSAIALYERAGYSHIARYNTNSYATHFFEKHLGSACSTR